MLQVPQVQETPQIYEKVIQSLLCMNDTSQEGVIISLGNSVAVLSHWLLETDSVSILYCPSCSVNSNVNL